MQPLRSCFPLVLKCSPASFLCFDARGKESWWPQGQMLRELLFGASAQAARDVRTEFRVARSSYCFTRLAKKGTAVERSACFS